MSDVPRDALAELVEVARTATADAYAPYSKFHAAAAVRTTDGDVVTGVIVENVSLGLAMCAERVALFATVSRGAARPAVLALAAPATRGSLTWPCGACLQVALELGGRDMVVVAGGADGDAHEVSTVNELLPRGPKAH